MKYIWIIVFQFICIKTVLSQNIYNKNDANNYFILHYSQSDSVPDSVKSVLLEVTVYLSKYIKTSIPINVHISWVSQKENIQASCSSFGYYSNFKNNPNLSYTYPICLAEKLSNEGINNSSEPDIITNINKNISWYYGIDGKPESNKVDLYTILLHEFCHGLGFQSNFVCENKIGYLFGNNLPFIFDSFISDSTKSLLLNNSKYQNNSISLFNALTSDSLLFVGPFTNFLNNEVKLYAPNIYNSGSSTNHVDFVQYPKGTDNSLMTYGKSLGEAIHKLGPVTEGILADIGWSDFFLSTKKQNDIENLTAENIIELYADSIFNNSILNLHYSFDSFTNTVVTPFSKSKNPNYYNVTIPNYPFEHIVNYYITANDTVTNKTAGIPLQYPKNFYTYKVGKDTIKPTISHQAITDILENTDSLEITTIVNDNLGVDSVWIEYRISQIDSNKLQKVKLQKKGFNTYSSFLSLKNLIVKGSVFSYRLFAVDVSINKNTNYTSGTTSDFYLITVGTSTKPFTTLNENFDDTITSRTQFILEGFTINKLSTFSSAALQTAHPYPTAIYAGKKLDLTATLRNPCTIREKEAYLEFDEIVLVEPSESGTVYGDYEFWDYCIIEGSKDKINWYAFEQKGYKTELFDNWIATFFSKTTTDENGKINSMAIGNEELYHHHKVNLLGNKYLRKGDNVYIRFRLFSDALQNGWGWSIDNLEIQTTSTSNTLIVNSNDDLKVYPTISNGNFKIINKKNKTIKSMMANSLYGISYPCILCEDNSVIIKANNGIYFLKTIFEDGSMSTNKIIISY